MFSIVTITCKSMMLPNQVMSLGIRSCNAIYTFNDSGLYDYVYGKISNYRTTSGMLKQS